jgi:hypothetical protein
MPAQSAQRRRAPEKRWFPAPALFQFVDGGLYRIVLFIVLRGEKRRFPPCTGFALQRGNIVILLRRRRPAPSGQDAGVHRSSA